MSVLQGLYDGCLLVPSSEHGDNTVSTKSPDWFAVFTLPRNEHSVARRLEAFNIESFLPTFEVSRVWRNRQHRRLSLPLFPTYLFARIGLKDRWRVLQAPGVVSIVGNSKGPIPVDGKDIELLRARSYQSKWEPYRGVLAGQRVRVKNGPISGVTGVLLRRKGGVRFVLSLEVINLHAVVEVDAHDVEPLTPSTGPPRSTNTPIRYH